MKLKRNILALTFFTTLGVVLSGCSGIKYPEIETKSIINDNYNSIYQIMPYSYADSNGDGIGDLRGIIDKLDYIDSLNYTGLWLTPVHPSETYHKYDVDNYMEIDKDLGTLSDYDELVAKCHQKKMTILLDLVLNHSSDDHPWFKRCLNAHKNHQPNNQYYNYYNVIELQSGQSVPAGYTKSGNFAYESRFWSGMPDLNLQYILDEPNGYLANEIRDIFKFWLVEHDIDGFRLDAVTSYFTGDEQRNLAFLTWLNTECKKLKSSCYIVGEASWGTPTENQRYQASGCDSFFEFNNQSAKGYVASVVMGDASFVSYALKKNKEIAAGGIEAPFVANHDTGRMIGCVKGRSNVNNLKFGHGILQMLNGATYTYYGDEIGLAMPSTSDQRDEDKRLPMNFGDNYTPKPVYTASDYDEKDVYPYGSVKDQEKDKNSVMNYVKKANLLRKQFKSIARGEFENIFTSQDDSFTAISKKYEDEEILILINASNFKSYEYDYSSTKFTTPMAELCVEGNAKLKGSKIEVPKQGIVILK